ncbi:hypothetical protein N0V83_005370 [Neocucurbitaria cava]|uniref:Uncharacterized protein n=1 Tax=Neocucurbitaria cava TaxID=798079 RepID=A0A9W9CLL1_9PLEO|nr:hypothetical protein N0V83_005370 [Neocucurbitaria cava]
MDQRTDPLYQKDGQLHTHTTTITSIHPLSSLPQETQALFKIPPPEEEQGPPYILTTPSTIFHAQGGGQPSDTGTIKSTSEVNNGDGDPNTFHVHQVRKVNTAILHAGTFSPPQAATPFSSNASSEHVRQDIDVAARLLHSRLHTAGHVIGLAIHLLATAPSNPPGGGLIPPDIVDGKASHYPGAAFVECHGLIPGTAKAAIQAKVDELVNADLAVGIHFWSEERARGSVWGCGELKGMRWMGLGLWRLVVVEEGKVDVIRVGDACEEVGECGKVVVRGLRGRRG